MAKKKKYNLGGTILNTIANAATGNFVGAGVSLLDGVMENIKPDEVTIDATYNSKPYGNMKHGGNFKQYNAPSHDNGGQMVDENGYPTTTNPTAEIQNDENSFNNYVYSDTLTNPKTGRTFNVDMSKLVKKYKNSDQDLINKTSLRIEAENLARTNDSMRSLVESQESDIPKMWTGGLNGDPPGVPPAVDPWGGVPKFTTATVKEINYGTRPETIKSFLKTQFSPQPIYDDTVYDYTEPNMFGNSTTVIDNSFGESKPSDAPRNKRNFNFNTAALVSKGLGLAGSIKNALTPAEIESARIPDYQPANQAFDRASIDYTAAEQQAIGASNRLAEINRSASSGYGQYRNREAARIASLQDSLANIGMSERNANAQLDMSRGQARMTQAQDVANRLREVDVANLQNIVAKQGFEDQLFSEITQIGSSFNKYQNFLTELQNRKDIAKMNAQELSALSKAMGYNFSLPEAEEMLKLIQSGQSPVQYNR